MAFRAKESKIRFNGFYELHPSITKTIYLCLPYARHEGTSGSGGRATLILKLVIKWRWVVSFTLRPQKRRDRITYKVRGNGSDVKHCCWLAIICATTTRRISPVVQLSDPVRCHSHLLLQLFSFEMRYVRLTESCLSKLITTFCTLSSPIFVAVSPEATPKDCNNFIRDQNR